MDLPSLQELYDLDERCMEYLYSLPPELQEKVARDFNHRPDQTNPSARCVAFAKGVAAAAAACVSAPLSTWGGTINADMEAFIAQWDLDDRCAALLASSPPEVVQRVIENFDHQPHQTNPSARCCAFIKSLATSGGRAAQTPERDLVGEIHDFQARWGIDDRCRDQLLACAPEVQSVVLEGFSHSPLQTNVSARCAAFINSVNKRLGVGPRVWHAPQEGIIGAAPASGARGEGAAGVPPARLRRFCAQWGIDDECAGYLASLPTSVQAVVFERFTHGPGQTNPSARCKVFARGIAASEHALQTRSAQHSPAVESFDELEVDADQPGRQAGALLEFQAQWDLDDKCIEYLSTLSAEGQALVIESFTHEAHHTNASARCMGFARKVAQRLNGACASSNVVGSSSWAPPVVRPPPPPPPPRPPNSLGDAWGRSSGVVVGSTRGVKRSWDEAEDESSASAVSAAELRRFKAKWCLDDKCIDFLGTLAPETQTAVMRDFHHRPDQTNVSARFMAFAKSVSNVQASASISTTLDGDLVEFQERWGLDQRCMDYLQSIPAKLQKKVVETFTHEPHHTNPSARCMALVRSICAGSNVVGGS